MSKFSQETNDFLKKEAKNLYNALPPVDKQKYGSYRPIFQSMKANWRKGAKLPPGGIAQENARHKQKVQESIEKATKRETRLERWKRKLGIG